jgi:hypothetical protein
MPSQVAEWSGLEQDFDGAVHARDALGGVAVLLLGASPVAASFPQAASTSTTTEVSTTVVLRMAFTGPLLAGEVGWIRR